MDTFQNKMDMSLDEIILQEQKKKGILRTNSDIEEIQGDEEILDVSPRVTMSSTNFIPEHATFVPRRVPGLSQHQWIQFKNVTRHNQRRRNVQKRIPGIPLIKLKKGYMQGILGNNNYKVRVWRQPKMPQFRSLRKYSGKSYPLTSNYLQQFNEQNHAYVPRRGPGSTGSRGSLCSNCSRTSSIRSRTSYRSMPSNRSVRSLRSQSSNSRKAPMGYRLRKYSGKSHPLTSNYLQQFNEQNHTYVPRRGPGSTGSRGSLYSNCSRTSSIRSRTSYRVRSLRSHSSHSRKAPKGYTYRFKYFLNRKIQQHILHMQENRALRVHNSSRENLIDEPAKCKPQPRHTWCTLHLRFKKYICNPIN